MVKATAKAGIFFQKLSLSPLQHVSSYQKCSPVNHPSAALFALLHTGTAALHLLPLKNFHLRTRHMFKQGTNTTDKILLDNSMDSCLSPARPMSQVGQLCLRAASCTGEGWAPSICRALGTRSPGQRCPTAGPQRVPAAFTQQLGTPRASRAQPEQRASEWLRAWTLQFSICVHSFIIVF